MGAWLAAGALERLEAELETVTGHFQRQDQQLVELRDHKLALVHHDA